MRPRFMTRKALVRAIDSRRIEEAIRQAERRTSGEIRVSVSRFFWGGVRRVAERAFARAHKKENLGAASVALSPEEVRQIEAAFCNIKVDGARAGEAQLSLHDDLTGALSISPIR